MSSLDEFEELLRFVRRPDDVPPLVHACISLYRSLTSLRARSNFSKTTTYTTFFTERTTAKVARRRRASRPCCSRTRCGRFSRLGRRRRLRLRRRRLHRLHRRRRC